MSKNDSKITKQTRARLWILRAIDYLVLVGPLVAYTIMGLCEEGAVHEKVALTGSIAVALILVVFNLITKKHLRSPLWIALIGIYVAVDNIMPLILTLAAVTLLDEFILSPLIANTKTALISNKQIDKRI